MTPLEQYLADDHLRLDALLRASIAGERFDHDAFEQFRAGLLRHIGIEEKLLLPHARKKRGEPLPAAAALRLEHAALGALLVPTPDHALAREIAALLDKHNLREEGAGGVYQQCAALAGADAEPLLEKIRAVVPPPLAEHFDGEGTYRTAAAALQAMERAFSRPKEQR